MLSIQLIYSYNITRPRGQFENLMHQIEMHTLIPKIIAMEWVKRTTLTPKHKNPTIAFPIRPS